MSPLTILDLASVLICVSGLTACGVNPTVNLPSPTPTEQAAASPTTDPTAPIEPTVVTADPNVVAPAPVVTPTPPPAIPTFNLTYYRAAITVTPEPSFTTHTSTLVGNCVVYNANTYCWDDGTKTIAQWKDFMGNFHGPYTNNYFELGYDTLNRVTICSNVCSGDVMSSPRTVAGSIKSIFTLTPSSGVPARYNAVLSGTPTSAVCYDSAGVLNCGSFSVDLNQAVIF